ncbi:MAG: hypothetical protein HUK09_00190 [Bacteroidaceae bacterium]|nr:hypothetical protein [Bacteroidaceae bacterium]
MRHFLSPLLLMVALCVSSCGQKEHEQSRAPLPPDDSTSLRVAVLPIVDALPLYYAQASGIARQLGLPLSLKTYAAQFDADTAMMGRTVDMGMLDEARLAYYQRRGQFRSVQPFHRMQGSWNLVVDQRQRIGKVADLKDRTILLARFDQSDAYWKHLADSVRFKADSYYTPQVNSFAIRLQMLLNHQTDAAILPEPFATWAVSLGHKRLASTERYPLAIYVRGKAMQNNGKKAQVQLLKRAYNQAVDELNRPKNALRDSLLQYRLHVPKSALPQLRLPRYNKVQ